MVQSLEQPFFNKSGLTFFLLSIKFFCNRRKVNLGCCSSFTVSKSSLCGLYLTSSTYHPSFLYCCWTFLPFVNIAVYCFPCELLLFFLALVPCYSSSSSSLMLFVNLLNCCCSLPSFCSCSLTFFRHFFRSTFNMVFLSFLSYCFCARHSFNTYVCSFLFSYCLLFLAFLSH